jgi:hypothetical protein
VKQRARGWKNGFLIVVSLIGDSDEDFRVSLWRFIENALSISSSERKKEPIGGKQHFILRTTNPRKLGAKQKNRRVEDHRFSHRHRTIRAVAHGSTHPTRASRLL